jgi:hypothetical protein
VAERVTSEEGDDMIAAHIRHAFAPLALIAALSVTPLKATTTPSKVVSREIQSINFAQSKIGVSPTRRMVVYLPAGYDESQKRYPVIYFFPDAFNSYSNLFDHKDAQSLFDRAIRMGMLHPDVFGSVYGMHPVGTGSGLKVMLAIPNWDLTANAKTLDAVRKDGASTIFTTIFEAFLPNPQKPPLYIDLAAHKDGDQLIIDTTLEDRVRANFFLESMIPQYAANLKPSAGSSLIGGAAI